MKKRKALAIPVIGAALFTEELYRYMFLRNGSAIFNWIFDSKGHKPEYYTFLEEKAKLLESNPHDVFTIESERGEKLKGFYYPFGSNGKKIAFIIHGYRSEHAETAGRTFEYYKSRGIDVFCCDHTASGESEGKFIGFDVFETKDCLRWLKFLISSFSENTEIILHGFSMGAATVLKMSSYCPENVKFIISDSGFVNARASLDHQVGPMYKPLRIINKLVAGYDLDDSEVYSSLTKAKLPILFVHGQDDRLVPFENGEKLYQMYQGDKDCFFPRFTRHVEAMYTCPDEYGKKIDSFVEKYL